MSQQLPPRRWLCAGGWKREIATSSTSTMSAIFRRSRWWVPEQRRQVSRFGWFQRALNPRRPLGSFSNTRVRRAGSTTTRNSSTGFTRAKAWSRSQPTSWPFRFWSLQVSGEPISRLGRPNDSVCHLDTAGRTPDSSQPGNRWCERCRDGWLERQRMPAGVSPTGWRSKPGNNISVVRRPPPTSARHRFYSP